MLNKNIIENNLEYQWQKISKLKNEWNDIKDETSKTYTVTENDIDCDIRCFVYYLESSAIDNYTTNNIITITFNNHGNPEFEITKVNNILKIIQTKDDPDGNNKVLSYLWESKNYNEDIWNRLIDRSNILNLSLNLKILILDVVLHI